MVIVYIVLFYFCMKFLWWLVKEGGKDYRRYKNDPRPVPKLQWYLSAGAFLIFPLYILLVPQTNYYSEDTHSQLKMQIVERLKPALQNKRQHIKLSEFSEILGFDAKPILRGKKHPFFPGLLDSAQPISNPDKMRIVPQITDGLNKIPVFIQHSSNKLIGYKPYVPQLELSNENIRQLKGKTFGFGESKLRSVDSYFVCGLDNMQSADNGVSKFCYVQAGLALRFDLVDRPCLETSGPKNYRDCIHRVSDPRLVMKITPEQTELELWLTNKHRLPISFRKSKTPAKLGKPKLKLPTNLVIDQTLQDPNWFWNLLYVSNLKNPTFYFIDDVNKNMPLLSRRNKEQQLEWVKKTAQPIPQIKIMTLSSLSRANSARFDKAKVGWKQVLIFLNARFENAYLVSKGKELKRAKKRSKNSVSSSEAGLNSVIIDIINRMSERVFNSDLTLQNKMLGALHLYLDKAPIFQISCGSNLTKFELINQRDDIDIVSSKYARRVLVEPYKTMFNQFDQNGCEQFRTYLSLNLGWENSFKGRALSALKQQGINAQ